MKRTFVTMKTMLILSLFAGTLMVASCSKSNDNSSDNAASGGTVTFTINGGGFNNQTITYTATSIVHGAATYNKTYKYTGAFIGDAAANGVGDNTVLTLYFNGSQTGQQNAGKAFDDQGGLKYYTEFSLRFFNQANQPNYEFASTGTTPGSITITSYGNVNGWIEGDFEGKIKDQVSQKTVTITNGHFKVARFADED